MSNEEMEEEEDLFYLTCKFSFHHGAASCATFGVTLSDID